METLRLGENQKRRAATAMNHRSSRAHSIFIVTLKQVCTSTNISRTSKLFLVDLGGCEQTKKSEISSGMSKHFERMKREVMNTVDAPKDENELPNEATNDIESNENTEFSTGFVKSERMREAVYINLGLMVPNSIAAATRPATPSSSSNPVAFAPFVLRLVRIEIGLPTILLLPTTTTCLPSKSIL